MAGKNILTYKQLSGRASSWGKSGMSDDEIMRAELAAFPSSIERGTLIRIADALEAINYSLAGIHQLEKEVSETKRSRERNRRRSAYSGNLAMPLGKIGLSRRAFSACFRAGAELVGDLVSLSPGDIYELSGVGWGTVNEIRSALDKLGLRLAGDPKEPKEKQDATQERLVT